MNKYKCPCCENYTFVEKPPGTYEICSICHWEDDNVQYSNPDYTEGANKMSLNEAKKAFAEKREIF